jgi:predicted nucleic acid-binding protein
MGKTRYLIDTNAVIDYLGGKLTPSGMSFMGKIIDSRPIISVITKIELLGFNSYPSHYQLLENFVLDAQVINLSEDIVDSCISIRKELKTKLPDAIIAATAVVNGLNLITLNTDDFKRIHTLIIIDPHSL